MTKLEGVFQEFGAQRMLLGDRAIELAGMLAEASAEIDRLRARIAELEKPKEESTVP